jgi:hypothetical protein
MRNMSRGFRWLLVGATVCVAACSSETSDGAVIRLGLVGLECQWVQLGTSHDQISRLTTPVAMIYTVSSRGKVHEELYLAPADAPADFELNEKTGELALELDLDRDSFEQEEVLYYDVETHSGYLLHLAYWFTEDCDDYDPPESYEPPSPP